MRFIFNLFVLFDLCDVPSLCCALHVMCQVLCSALVCIFFYGKKLKTGNFSLVHIVELRLFNTNTHVCICEHDCLAMLLIYVCK